MRESLIRGFAEAMIGTHEHRLIGGHSDDIRDLSTEESYAVQERYLAARIAVGDEFVGYKVGCTSAAIRRQLGLSEPICGRLLATHVHSSGQVLAINEYVDCAVEAELVFHIGIDLDGGNLDTSHLRSAIAAVSPGIEIHNCRFRYGTPSLQELIASNGIHAGLVIGDPRQLSCEIELRDEGMVVVVNQIETASGLGADLMGGGGPIASLRWLVTHLSERNLGLRAGSLVIPGSATRLLPVRAGDLVEARFTTFGTCRAIFR